MSRLSIPGLAHPEFRGVQLDENDVASGEALSREANWNQTAGDWEFMLRAGHAFGFETPDRTLVASALLLPHGDSFAWISMVLVSEQARRRGLATLLLQHALVLARENGFAALLDATAEGRQVYLKLGFRDLRSITRWSTSALIAAPTASPLPAGIQPLRDLAGWAHWDEAIFGASRLGLLQFLRTSQEELAWELIDVDSERRGFCLGRKGRVARQLGPVIANTEQDAYSLLVTALGRVAGPAFIDLVDGHPVLEQLLRQRGFSPARAFVRMIQGPAEEPGDPSRIFAIAGPELG